MNLDHPRWDVLGVAVTIVTAFAGILITLISISDGYLRLIGSFITIISIVVLVALFWKFRASKEITYQVISDTTVLKIEEGKELEGRIQVLLDGTKPLKDARIVVLKIWNSGNTTIEPNDYRKNRPLNISFGKDAEVLQTEVLEAYPKCLTKEVQSTLKQDKSNVLIEPIALEKNNFITLKLLLTKFSGTNEINFDETDIVGTPIVN